MKHALIRFGILGQIYWIQGQMDRIQQPLTCTYCTSQLI